MVADKKRRNPKSSTWAKEKKTKKNVSSYGVFNMKEDLNVSYQGHSERGIK